ncbi:MAG: hypothetical protein H7175_15315 [Burkholderiales bacterium]|nr:hypothetical protein [Anaerolineae bacterium]
MLLLSTLACWSSDTLFITLTATTPPTAIPPTPSVATLFSIGDSATIAGSGIGAVYLTEVAEPITRRNRVPNASCYPGSTVDILAAEEVDGIMYYNVECNNTGGWLAEAELNPPGE